MKTSAKNSGFFHELTRNTTVQLVLRCLPLAIEIFAVIWVLMFYSFEGIIPVYQGY